MGSEDSREPSTRARREPPPYRPVTVSRVKRVTSRMVRVSFVGPELGLLVVQPAASVRLLLPAPNSSELVLPRWDGNEFLLPDGQRPTIRTFTPRRFNRETLELDLEIVIHNGGVASAWAQAAEPGDPAAISGPGRGFEIDSDASAMLLAGDETAIPAIGQILEALPAGLLVQVLIEVGHPEARLRMPDHPLATIKWCDLPSGASPGEAVVAAVRDADLIRDTRIWAAGEAAAMQVIRRHLAEDRAIPRGHTTVRGYWKRGRRGT